MPLSIATMYVPHQSRPAPVLSVKGEQSKAINSTGASTAPRLAVGNFMAIATPMKLQIAAAKRVRVRRLQ